MRITDEVKGAKSIGIGGHIRPDGDCVGSCLGMYLFLKKVMSDDTVIEVILEDPPQIFDCLAGYECIQRYPRRQAYDVFIAIDCASDRLGDAEAGFNKAHKTINIDHHISNKGCADVDYIFSEASSASELVYEVIDKDQIDESIAKALYTGIIHDTGVLRYSNTSPKTLNAVAKLIEYGFDFPKLIDETFFEKTYVQNQILGRALTESILFMDGKCIVAGIDRRTMQFYGVDSKDMDGIVNQLRYTKGVEVAIFMYELESLKWKVSMRSCSDEANVAAVAEMFGGGGHVRAAGCMLDGSFHDAVNNLSRYLEKQLVK